jgi:hypothetical protein
MTRRKLRLSAETVRVLSESQAQRVFGGSNTCPGSPAVDTCDFAGAVTPCQACESGDTCGSCIACSGLPGCVGYSLPSNCETCHTACEQHTCWECPSGPPGC